MKKSIVLLTALLIFTRFPDQCRAQLRESPVEEVTVTSPGLNVRAGAGVWYPVIGQTLKGEVLPVIGAENGWYLVRLADGSYGMVCGAYTRGVSVKAIEKAELPQGDDESAKISEMSDTQLLFSLVNAARSENGLTPFVWDEKLNDAALQKGIDMRDHQYFSHESPTYGTPFKMLKTFGIDYSGASENLVANLPLEQAHSQMMANPSHRSNILSPRFNKMGAAIVKSPKYGNIIVELFVEE